MIATPSPLALASKQFFAFCREHGISEVEGARGALDLLVTYRGVPERRWFTPDEIRAMRPEAIAAILDYPPEGVPPLHARAEAVEQAHALWVRLA